MTYHFLDVQNLKTKTVGVRIRLPVLPGTEKLLNLLQHWFVSK